MPHIIYVYLNIIYFIFIFIFIYIYLYIFIYHRVARVSSPLRRSPTHKNAVGRRRRSSPRASWKPHEPSPLFCLPPLSLSPFSRSALLSRSVVSLRTIAIAAGTAAPRLGDVQPAQPDQNALCRALLLSHARPPPVTRPGPRARAPAQPSSGGARHKKTKPRVRRPQHGARGDIASLAVSRRRR